MYLVVLATCLSAFDAVAQEKETVPLTELSIEELLNVEVYSASKFVQKITEAPASVTIVTHEDIKRYGYRTLADILRSVRGMHISYDRNYMYLGVRGFGRTGDFNGRFLLLLDGYRLNDTIFDSAYIGTEFPLDVSLIDRVEVVRGPGSSIYGSNAVFGIINVITRHGSAVDGVELSGEVASFGTDKERVSWGGRRDDGVEWLLSASRYRSDGQDLDFPEFDGTARNLDHDRYDNLFGKLTWGGFSLTSAWSSRTKGIPTASYDTVFNDSRAETLDGVAFVDLGYYRKASRRWDVDTHVFYGQYVYDGVYPYIYEAGEPATLNTDETQADWWGVEVKLVGRLDRHTLVLGSEYQDNFRQDQSNYDDIDPRDVYLDDKRSSTRAGFYLQDEAVLREGLRLSAGLRYDDYSTVGSTINPRLGLIWNPVTETTLKLLYGTAFRAPNTYELNYAVEPQKANPNLDPEKITSYELVLEFQYRPDSRLTVAIYRNMISDLINQVTDPADDMIVFENTGKAETKGIEFEAERLLSGGSHLRASYALQNARDGETGERLVNSPRHLAKLNYAVPMFGEGTWAGLELQYTGARQTLGGDTSGGYTLANLTLTSRHQTSGLEVSASVYNLFDTEYDNPAGEEHVQDVIAQDGRNCRLKLDYRF
jgi:iron complex outermembrane receptor protein